MTRSMLMQIEQLKYLETLQDKLFRIKCLIAEHMNPGEQKDRILQLIEAIETKTWNQHKQIEDEIDAMMTAQYDLMIQEAQERRSA